MNEGKGRWQRRSETDLTERGKGVQAQKAEIARALWLGGAPPLFGEHHENSKDSALTSYNG